MNSAHYSGITSSIVIAKNVVFCYKTTSCTGPLSRLIATNRRTKLAASKARLGTNTDYSESRDPGKAESCQIYSVADYRID